MLALIQDVPIGWFRDVAAGWFRDVGAEFETLGLISKCWRWFRGGHSCIGNSGAVLRRSFTAAIPAVITPTQRPLKLSAKRQDHIRPLLFPERSAPFFTFVFKFQFPKLLHNGGLRTMEMMAAKFLPSTSFPFPLLFYLLIIMVFRCMCTITAIKTTLKVI
jgi:hypothetical protein